MLIISLLRIQQKYMEMSNCQARADEKGFFPTKER
jgi:hypothetical protein